MGTRCGSLDPGVMLHLMTRHGLDAGQLEHLIYHESGLLGVSGVSSDMRTLLAAGGPRISHAGSGVAVRILPTNEELMIANHTRRVLGLNEGTE